MTRRERQILRWIEENPMISQQELADRAGITRSSMGVHISRMMKKGYIADVRLLRAEDDDRDRNAFEVMLDGAAHRRGVLPHRHGVHEHRHALHLAQRQERGRDRAAALPEHIPADEAHEGILHRP